MAITLKNSFVIIKQMKLQILEEVSIRFYTQFADIKGREGVLAMGIGKYNEECRSIVMR